MQIETRRLLMRPMELDDLDELVSMHAAPEVRRFMQDLGRQAAIERLEADRRDWAERGHGLLAVLDRQSSRFIGRIGLKYWPQFDETEVGWVLRREVRGRGFATEAAQACAA